MVTFVIYDDMEDFRKKTEKLVRKIMEKEKMNYQIESYSEYNSQMKKTIENHQVPKIYLLDIDVPNSESGIDIARKRRKRDWNSIIILVTVHMDLGYEALKAKIMVLDYISKHHDWKNSLTNTVKEALRRLDQNNVLIVENGGITYRIYMADILYILKDSVERKCLIKTIDGNIIPASATLSEIGELLDERFYLSHRSCYINLERITSVNWKKNIIYFEEGEEIDYLSRNKKRGLKEYVRSS